MSDLYTESLGGFQDDLKTILTQHHALLDTELREKIVGSLVLLRRKDVINSTELLTTLFPVLVATSGKTLRAFLLQKILMDLRNSNRKGTNHKLNRTIQTVLYNLVTSDRTSPRAIWAVRITRELWKRQLWTDAKPVDVMREACLADNERVVSGAVRFFLGGDQEREDADDESSDDEAPDLRKLQHQQKTNKKTKKQAKALKKAVEKVNRAEKKKNQHQPLNFSALHLLHDPQGFADSLFSKHLFNTKTKLKLETKLLVLQLVTRLVGLHRLTILSLYSWFMKYLVPKQQSVTSFLASLAQATHDHVPPDAIEPLILKIANEFVNEGSATEVAAAGLNAIREICARQPLAMKDALLQDLVAYRKSKDKGVMMAAKGLLSLYRLIDPELLERKDRGKDASMGLRSGDIKQKRFGEQAQGGIEGLDLLEKWKEEEKKRKREQKGLLRISDDGSDKDGEDEDDGEYNSSDWDVESVGSSDSGGWINVSDSEDDEPASKRQKQDRASPEAGKDDAESAAAEAERVSKLATTSILTPADLAKLQELRREANIDKALGKTKRQKALEARHVDDGLTAEQIELPARLAHKATKEERVALAREGKPDREEHKSTHAIRKAKKEAEGKSTTNKDKAKRKNLMMTMGKAKSKQKRSLVQTRKVLQAHVERSKRGGRRGNRG